MLESFGYVSATIHETEKTRVPELDHSKTRDGKHVRLMTTSNYCGEPSLMGSPELVSLDSHSNFMDPVLDNFGLLAGYQAFTSPPVCKSHKVGGNGSNANAQRGLMNHGRNSWLSCAPESMISVMRHDFAYLHCLNNLPWDLEQSAKSLAVRTTLYADSLVTVANAYAMELPQWFVGWELNMFEIEELAGVARCLEEVEEGLLVEGADEDAP
ncbi:hypothetical protein BDV96DRAFT_694665 [Lophiotrema nucula]|uniref:Uncharacterized protein n=1 Tax=Lophiotrema nucula TaxID=690887 RepID=A0A6A5YG68_9PLEO|nr:hypothetical protein BDV96DRAFT_694665 [Lophiotrema nucula]